MLGASDATRREAGGSSASGRELPFTGLDAPLIVALGLGALGLGAVLRRVVRVPLG